MEPTTRPPPSATGCRGAAFTATALGVPAAVAGQVAQFTHQRFDQPSEYHSKQCHAGGELDLELAEAPSDRSY